MLSYVLPTRNRPERLQRTIAALGALSAAAHERIGGGEVIVVDNASDSAPRLPGVIENGLLLHMIRLDDNRGAAARNVGVENARGDWIIMLDDDSHPLDSNHLDVLIDAPSDIAAIGAEIFLLDGSRERGGLPEVIIGCGAAIRRQAFLDVGGYEDAFEYYAEEYDLCARFILAGWRISHDARFRVLHEKVAIGRDFNGIVHRLVRNNAWVMQRYAPPHVRQEEIMRTIQRYASIATAECAARGFAHGMAELAHSLSLQPRSPMPQDAWDRFTGAAAARDGLREIAPAERVAIVDAGKNCEIIREILTECGVTITDDLHSARTLVVGTLSPGPAADSCERQRDRRGCQRVVRAVSPFVDEAAALRCADERATIPV